MPAETLEEPAKVSPAVNGPVPLKTIVELRLKKKSNAEITEMFGVSRQSIYKRVKGLLEGLDGDRLEAYWEHKVSLLEFIESK